MKKSEVLKQAGKAVKPVKAGPKVAPVEKVKVKPFTDFTADLITKGGTWEELVSKGTAEADSRGLTGKFNESYIKAVIKWRSTRNPINLGKLKVTDKGIL